jgi:hypothetical protein
MDGNMERFVNDSPTKVQVGRSTFEIYRKHDSVLQMLGRVEVTDPSTGERAIIRTPTPGWDFKLLEINVK